MARSAQCYLCSLEGPAGAVGAAEVLVGFVEVGEAEVGGVPEERAEGEVFAELDAEGDVAEEDGLGEGTGPVEVGAGGRAAFAGAEPFLVVVGGTGDGLADGSSESP